MRKYFIQNNHSAECKILLPGIDTQCFGSYFGAPSSTRYIPIRLVPEAIKLANVSYDAYYSCKELESRGLSGSFRLRHCINNSATNTQGYIATDDHSVVIAFRGTQETRDFFTDLNTKSVYFSNGRRCRNNSWRCVHEGFYKAFESTYSKCVNAVKSYASPNKKIYITGHSLGGAIATLFTYRLSYELSAYKTQMHMFIFGAPPVGNSIFINKFNSRRIGSSNVITIIGDAVSYEHCAIGSALRFLSTWFEVYHKPDTVYYLPKNGGHKIISYVEQLDHLYVEIFSNGFCLQEPEDSLTEQKQTTNAQEKHYSG